MNLKCLLGMHRWAKQGGPTKRAGGRFEQRYVCAKCGKAKSVTA